MYRLHLPSLVMWNRSYLLTSQLVLLPTLIIVVYFLWGFTIYTGFLSFTDSKFLPNHNWVGLKQYYLLWSNARWLTAYGNLFIFGGLYLLICVLLGGLLAVLMDQEVLFENLFRTVYLYPMSLSLVVTGLSWQWLLNPTLGLQKILNDFGFHGFALDWIVSSQYSIYAVVLAAVWHGSGLIMILFLAGLRAVDEDIWKSINVEGIPAWKAYLWIILPQLRPILLAAILLLTFNVVRSFDLVVAMTSGGPGFSSDVPAKYIYDYFFSRSNIARGAAAAVCTVLTVLLIISPYLYFELRKKND